MKKKKKEKKMGMLIGIGVVVIIILAIILLTRNGSDNYSSGSVDEFAKCLTEEGAVMYGAFWCPHCARTKASFGDSFSYINYVECDPRGDNEQSELCIEKGIEEYDTWEFTDGSRVIGEPTFQELSDKTGCPLPV